MKCIVRISNVTLNLLPTNFYRSLTTTRPLLSLPHHHTFSQADTLPPIPPLFNPDSRSTFQTAQTTALLPRPLHSLSGCPSLTQALSGHHFPFQAAALPPRSLLFLLPINLSSPSQAATLFNPSSPSQAPLSLSGRRSPS
jgi:hypothetical protein